MSRTLRDRLRRAAGLCALAAASLALSLAAAEGVLRYAGFSYPLLHVADELAGLRLRANAEGWYRSEGEAYVRINSHGWRDAERSLERPAGALRVAVLGDSFTEALQVPLEKTFPARLERELNECRPGGVPRVEVLNFGVSGYGTAQQLLTLRERVWQYDPQVVLLAFLPLNDVANNSRALEPWHARPFFVPGSGGALVLDASFRDDPDFRDKLESAPLHAALAELRLHQLVRRVRDGSYEGWRAGGLGESGIAEQALAPPADPDWREAWAVTEKLVEAMHADVAARGARFLVGVLPGGAAVYPDAAQRESYAAALGLGDYLYPERRIAAMGRARGFEVVGLTGPMREHAERTGEYLHGFDNTRPGFGHWNDLGHRVAAGVLAKHLCGARYRPRP
jgi:lysophospholipase L1-like esterase